ncbi:MAG: hypothetical protein K6B72_08875 [Lachnospiraceae bacterium]|nr:hypothetical protein [Lachnospiraceae bacterium]
MKAGVIYPRCSVTKKEFGVALEEREQGGWTFVRAYQLGSSRSISQDDDTQYTGGLYRGPDYNGCPFCQGGIGLVLCGKCHQFSCYDKSGSFTCGHCGHHSQVEGTIEGFGGSGGN